MKVNHDMPSIIKSSAELPALIEESGNNARFAYEEFLAGIDNLHTRKAYTAAVHRLLEQADRAGLMLSQITPKFVRSHIDGLQPRDGQTASLSAPTRKLHLAALRTFFDIAVTRHAMPLNPALSVKGPRHQAVEGKTFEATVKQTRKLIQSIDDSTLVGLRDRLAIMLLVYTAARVGAVSRLRIRDFCDAGEQFCLHFREKSGKDRIIPCRHDLEATIRLFIERAALQEENKDAPLLRSAIGKTDKLTRKPMSAIDLCRMVKRRVRQAGLPAAISPHSFRVCSVTDLLSQGVALEDVQHLAGHADPRTTRIYDRRQRKITRNIVERISV